MKLFTLLILFASIPPVFAIEMSTESLAINDAGVLQVLAEKPMAISFNPAPVEGGKAYLLTFEAKATGVPLIENNPRAHVARYENSALFWRWRLAFNNVTNQSCGQLAYSHMTVFSSEWRAYKDVFYAPQESAFVSLRFSPPAVPVALEIRNVTLEPYDRSGAVNLNGDFSLGEACHAGWGSPFAGADFRIIDGKNVFDTAYGTESARLPLDDKLAYRLTVKRTTYGGYTAANFYLHGESKLLKMCGVPASGTLDLVLPAGTTWGYLKIYNSFLESASLTILGPKEILQE